MSVTWKGSEGPQLILEEPYYDSEAGQGLRREWKGSRNAINSVIASLPIGISWDIRKESGPVYVLSAKYPSFGGLATEEVTMRVNVVTEIVEKDIWAHPTVTAGLETLTTAQKIQFKTDVENIAETGDFADLANWAGDPERTTLAFDMLDELAKGQTGYHDETISVRIMLSFDSTGAAPAQPIYSSRMIYSTAQLPLPAGLKFTLPNSANLTNVTGSVWGWKLRAQESEYDGAKVVQTFEFTLAQWSTFLYIVSTSDFVFA